MPTITPEQLAASGSEDGHQLAIFQWIALNSHIYPELKWLHHSPNGGFRNKREAAKLKAMGVKSGFPDLFLPKPNRSHAGLFIELKRPDSVGKKAGKASTEQDEWKEYLIRVGYLCIVCYGWEDAVKVLKEYLER